MQLNSIQPSTPKKSRKRIARGGKRGKTAGRGTKGQKSRAGRKIRPAERDLIKKLPKLRGYRFKSLKNKRAVVSVSAIDHAFQSGDVVNPASLVVHKLIEKKGKIIPAVKIVSDGTITKKVTVEGCAVSVVAREKIEKAGGAVKE
ncbi:50S ribosomal protein L15 [Candidatus Azambacteria bacterium RBG_16_47_10]|uniref:Large ribosomal subunit protein uL15 n=1 Tax=Candidatus Azambacteria bacterium RBG_16_47_10 TaxID=1797292 RepID=A0A1F5AYL1_9BACT|nr:MAG: 50S ribosomal protein L15 [Candidatus Azambacteria bacterium RBG_16_47_10]